MQLLDLGLLPVVYGDQVLDEMRGCTIFSTEKVLGFIGLELQKRGYTVATIVYCGQTKGVYDRDGNTIPLINSDTFHQYSAVLSGSAGVDVTGGMLHKVEESLKLAQQGIPGLIIDGIESGCLSRAVMGEVVVGTRIER